MFELSEGIESIEQVKKANILLYSVSKREVINKDYARILKNLQILDFAGKEAKEKLMLTFDGYDSDRREIYMIPEIREFVKHIYDKYNYIFYFLTTLDNNRNVIYACINDFKSLQNKSNNITSLEIIFNQNTREKQLMQC